MDVQIKEASIKQKPVLERLMQLYLYDFSEIEIRDVNQEGLFEYEHLNSYWIESDRFPFLIYVDSEIVGFVLVNSYVCLHEKGKAKSIAEFFVLRAYRRRGVGRSVAFQIFKMFPGNWEIRQIQSNVGGQCFWRKIIDEYTGGRFEETFLDNELWCGPAQRFNNAKEG